MHVGDILPGWVVGGDPLPCWLLLSRCQRFTHTLHCWDLLPAQIWCSDDVLGWKLLSGGIRKSDCVSCRQLLSCCKFHSNCVHCWQLLPGWVSGTGTLPPRHCLQLDCPSIVLLVSERNTCKQLSNCVRNSCFLSGRVLLYHRRQYAYRMPRWLLLSSRIAKSYCLSVQPVLPGRVSFSDCLSSQPVLSCWVVPGYRCIHIFHRKRIGAVLRYRSRRDRRKQRFESRVQERVLADCTYRSRRRSFLGRSLRGWLPPRAEPRRSAQLQSVPVPGCVLCLQTIPVRISGDCQLRRRCDVSSQFLL
jgi:hypothetical protein